MNLDHHILLVDCDLRRPSAHRLFGIDQHPGLSDHLSNQLDLAPLIQKTVLPRLSMVTAGKSPFNPTELLTSERMVRFLDEVKNRYKDRVVVLDSPPAMVAAELSVLAGFAEGIVLVVKEGGPKREHVMEVIQQLDKKKILGIVGNFASMQTSGYYYKSKRYKKYYQQRTD
jgi:capsular exopolysaccharide synthesis family protein